MTDVGDAVQLTFTTLTGATVIVDLYDPTDTLVDSATPVAEAGAGTYPYTFTATSAGDWTARFTASGAVTAVETYRIRATDRLAVTLTRPAFATIEDLTKRPGGPYTADELACADTLLDEVSEEIRGLGGTWLPTAVPVGIVGLVCRAVRREIRNPDRDITETYASYAHRIADGQTPTTGLLTEAERASIRATVTGVTGDAAFNLRADDAAYTRRAVARRHRGPRTPVGGQADYGGEWP